MASGRSLSTGSFWKRNGPVIGAGIFALASFAQLDPICAPDPPRALPTRDDVGVQEWARRSVEALRPVIEDPWGLYDPLDPTSVERYWRTVDVLALNAKAAEGEAQ